jgi:hypothetical protein
MFKLKFKINPSKLLNMINPFKTNLLTPWLQMQLTPLIFIYLIKNTIY